MRVGLGVAADEDDDYDDGLDAAYGADSPPPQALQDVKGKMEARGHAGFVLPVLCPRGSRTYVTRGRTSLWDKRALDPKFLLLRLFVCVHPRFQVPDSDQQWR
jgi:hypothetical protein